MKPHRAATQLAMWRKCHRQWAFRYMENLKVPPMKAYLHTGKGMHAGAELDLKHKMATGELAELQEVQDRTRDATNQAFEEVGITLVEDDIKKGEKKVRGEAVDTAVKLVTVFHEQVAPYRNPVAVEEPWILTINNWPVDYIGFIDYREPNHLLGDIKTTGKTPSAMDLGHLNQLALYAMWHKKETGILPIAQVDYLLKTKPKEGRSQFLSFKRQVTDTHLQNLKFMLEDMEDGILKENWTPAPPGAWWCSETQCGYWSRCEYVR